MRAAYLCLLFVGCLGCRTPKRFETPRVVDIGWASSNLQITVVEAQDEFAQSNLAHPSEIITNQKVYVLTYSLSFSSQGAVPSRTTLLGEWRTANRVTAFTTDDPSRLIALEQTDVGPDRGSIINILRLSGDAVARTTNTLQGGRAIFSSGRRLLCMYDTTNFSLVDTRTGDTKSAPELNALLRRSVSDGDMPPTTFSDNLGALAGFSGANCQVFISPSGQRRFDVAESGDANWEIRGVQLGSDDQPVILCLSSANAAGRRKLKIVETSVPKEYVVEVESFYRLFPVLAWDVSTKSVVIVPGSAVVHPIRTGASDLPIQIWRYESGTVENHNLSFFKEILRL